MKIRANLFTLLALMLGAVQAHSSTMVQSESGSDFKLGVMGGWSSGPYDHFDRKIVPFPVIIYDSPVFYIRGVEAGFKLFQSGSDELTLSASMYPVFFKPGDAKTEAIKSLDERKISGMTGATWSHNAAWGFTGLSAKHRFTGNKEGYSMAFTYGYPFLIGKLTLITSTGIEYSDKKLNQYYYSISDKESGRSGLSTYNPGSGTNYYADILAIYPLTKKIDVSAGARVTRLSDEVVNSPMTGDRLMHSFLASLTYSF